MPVQNKHKAKASREWQKKHGMVQPKMTKKQKEKGKWFLVFFFSLNLFLIFFYKLSE